MPPDGYIKFLRSGRKGRKINALPDDGTRWRWWLLYCMGNIKTFPGLLAEPSLQPYKESEIVSYVYESFHDGLKALKKWREEKELMLKVGLIKRVWIDCEEYIWNNDFHIYQDMFSAKGKKLSDRFSQIFDEFDGRNKVLFFTLIYVFKPSKLEFWDIEKDQIFKPPFTLPLLDHPVFLPSSAPLCLPSTLPSALPCTLPFNCQNAKKEGSTVGQTVGLGVGKKPLPFALPFTLPSALPFRGIRIKNKEERKKNPLKPPDPNVKKFIDWWFEKFKAEFQETYQVVGGKDGSIVKDLLQGYEIEKLISLGEIFFKSDDPFITNSAYSIGVFKSQVNKLLTQKKKKESPKPGPGRIHSRFDQEE